MQNLLYCVCVCPVWVPCVALISGGGSSVGPSPLCGSPVWVPCVGPLCVGPLCGSPVWVPRPVALRHVASTRVMSPARSHAPAYIAPPPPPVVLLYQYCAIYGFPPATVFNIQYWYWYCQNRVKANCPLPLYRRSDLLYQLCHFPSKRPG